MQIERHEKKCSSFFCSPWNGKCIVSEPENDDAHLHKLHTFFKQFSIPPFLVRVCICCFRCCAVCIGKVLFALPMINIKGLIFIHYSEKAGAAYWILWGLKLSENRFCCLYFSKRIKYNSIFYQISAFRRNFFASSNVCWVPRCQWKIY